MNAETKQMKNWKGTFATIYAGQAFSIIGSAAVQFAIIWWITYQTESALYLALATIASFLPNMLIGPFAGVWVDRFNRRTVMMLADGLVALSSVALMVVFILNAQPSVWVLFAVLFARGLGATFHQPAMQAAIPMLVPGDKLTKANGWSSLVTAGGSMLGPVLGAALMGFAPIQYIMLVDIAGAAFAIICLCFVKIPNVPQSGEKVRVFADMRVGLETMRKNRPLMAAILPFTIINLLAAPIGSLFPLLIRTQFNGTQWHSGIGELLFGLGMLVGSAAIGVFGGAKKRFLVITVAVIVLAAGTVLAGLLPPYMFWMLLVLTLIMGAASPFANVIITTYIQETTPAQQLGKVLSLFMTVLTLAMPFGLLVAGPVSEVIGVANWYIISGIGIVLMSLWLFGATNKYDKTANIEHIHAEKINIGENA